MPTVEYEFTADTRALEAALGAVDSKVDDLDGSFDEASEAASGGLGAVAVAAAAAGAAIAGVAVLVGKAAAKLAVNISKNTVTLAESANRLAKAGKKVGASASDIELVGRALGMMTENGVDAARMLQDLGRNLSDARDGTGEAVTALDKLGLSAEDLIGLSIDEQLAMIADQWPTLRDGAEKSQVAMDLFGRTGREMAIAMGDGGDAIRSTIEAVRVAGVVSADTARKSEDLIDAIDLMEQSMGSLKREVLEPLIPVFTGILRGITDVINETRGFSGSKEATLLFAEGIARGLVPALSLAGEFLENLIGELKVYALGAYAAANAGRGLGMILQGEFEMGRMVIEASGRDFTRFADSFVQMHLDMLSDSDSRWDDWSDTVMGYIDDAKAVTASFGSSGSGSIKDVGDAAGDAAGKIGEMADALGDLDLDMLDELASAPSILDAMIDAGEFDEVLTTIEDRFREFKEFWQSGFGEIVNSAAQLAMDIVDLFADMAKQTMKDRIAAADETRSTIENIEERLTEATDAAEKGRLTNLRATLLEREKAQKEAALEAFKTQQSLALVSAAINTALAVINALATAPTIFAGIALAALAGAAGGIAIAKIATQKPPQFHSGGFIRASTVASRESVPINAKAGEGVLSNQGMAAIGGRSGLEAANRGQSTAGGTTYNIMRIGTRTTEVISHRQLRSRSGKMQRELSKIRPKVGRSIPGRR